MLCAFEQAERPRRFAIVSADGRLSVFDTSTSTLSNSFARPTHLPVRWTCVGWQKSSEAEGMVAMGSDAGVVVVWDISRGEIVHELRGHTQAVHDVAFCNSSSGPQLLTAGDDQLVCCWDLKTGSQLPRHKTGKAAVHRLAVSSSSTHVMLGSGMLKLVTFDTWKKIGWAMPSFRQSVSPRPRSLRPPNSTVLGSSSPSALSLSHASPQNIFVTRSYAPFSLFCSTSSDGLIAPASYAVTGACPVMLRPCSVFAFRPTTSWSLRHRVIDTFRSGTHRLQCSPTPRRTLAFRLWHSRSR